MRLKKKNKEKQNNLLMEKDDKKPLVRYDYLNKIKNLFKIYTARRTANVLEGNFRSTILGKGMEFYDLKEYAYGDDIRDIDWKTSSHANKTLVRRYVSDRRHNVLFVLDTGKKMLGDTLKGEPKEEISTMIFGTIAYLVERQSSNVALMYSNSNGIYSTPFRMGINFIEKEIYDYHDKITNEPFYSLDYVLRQASDQSRKKRIIVVVTDVSTMDSISEKTYKRLLVNNDVLFAVMEDMYLTGKNTFDIDSDDYGDPFIIGSSNLREAEIEHRREMFLRLDRITKKYRIASAFINSEDEVIKRSVELFNRFSNQDFGFGRGQYEDFG